MLLLSIQDVACREQVVKEGSHEVDGEVEGVCVWGGNHYLG